jgi:hypothetical protein
MSALKEVLRKYEESLGQKVNYKKSWIFLGKGCQEESLNSPKNLIDINCEALSEKYIDLPMVMG